MLSSDAHPTLSALVPPPVCRHCEWAALKQIERPLQNRRPAESDG
jgi:hypothetical protein